MPRPSRTRLVALGLPAVVAACAATSVVVTPGEAAPPRTATVRLAPASFMPDRVVIARGGTVTWRWAGGAKHNVTWVGGRKPAASSSTKASGSYRVRFRRKGTYRYECTIHAGIGMVGTVVVR